MSRLSVISVDLDSLPHYCRIHGLDEAMLDARARSLVATAAVPRFLELLSRAKVPATFFVIGADVDGALSSVLGQAHREGVELASHSFAHDYRMSRWPDPAIARDLQRAHEAITAIAGQPPVGFRAPGYTLSAGLLHAVEAMGYRYDSSVFPAAAYYLAKAGVLSAQRLAGRRSGSMLDSPSVLLAPRRPYRPDPRAPYREGGSAVVELPVAVERYTRVPFIGTLALGAPWPAVALLARSLAREPLINFELHAIDVLDGTDGIPAALAAVQPDVNVSSRDKLARLTRLVERLGEGRELVTAADAARQF